MRTRLISLAALCVFIMSASVWALGYGDAAPDFTLTDTDGQSHTLSDYRDQVVYLNFFGWS